MDVLIYIAGAVVFFGLVMASIALHEIGHLVPGKVFNVKITEYFVGFGRKVWARRRGETEYGVKAIPVGGYVRLVGMFPPAKDHPGQVRAYGTGPFRALADNARAVEWSAIRPEDEGRLFYEKPFWQKLIIMASGPAMNILLAFVILLGVSLTYGAYRSQLTISKVQECIVVATAADQSCTGKPPTPAAQSGIQPGDKIVAFNGTPVSSWDDVSRLIRANLDHQAVVAVERGGQTLDLKPVTTVITGVPDRYDPSKRVAAGFFGVEPEIVRQRGGPVAVIGDMWQMTKQTVVALAYFPVKVFYTAYNLATGKPRDVYGPMSIVGASRAAGEIAATNQISPAAKLASLFTVLGSVNLFVALFNFVPLLPLDGGHVAAAMYEAIRRGLARVFGRPDPGHVDTARLLPIAYVVGGVILISGAVLILADIIDPIRLF
jgi:membrane-associated protease RseP (regulator of RpoE activity)